MRKLKMFDRIRVLYRLAVYIWDNTSNSGQKIKRTVMAVIWQVYKRTLKYPYITKLPNGYNFVVDPKSGNSTGVIYTRVYEPEYTDLLHKTFKSQPGGVCIDAGAHVGLFSFQLAHLFDKVFCFEPAPDNYSFLTRNIAINQNCNVVAYRKAVSIDQGKVHFEITGKFSGTNRIISTDEIQKRSSNVIETEVVSIDDFVKEKKIADVRFIKIDTEGHEVKVLQGAAETIRNNNVIILIENSLFDEVEEQCKKMDLVLFSVDKKGRIFKEKNKLAKAYNVFAIKNGDQLLEQIAEI